MNVFSAVKARTFDFDYTRVEPMRVENDEMSPTLQPNDWLLWDMEVRRYTGDGIYLINYDGPMLVRRLQKLFVGGDYLVLCDNPQCRNETIQAHNLKIVAKLAAHIKRY